MDGPFWGLASAHIALDILVDRVFVLCGMIASGGGGGDGGVEPSYNSSNDCGVILTN